MDQAATILEVHAEEAGLRLDVFLAQRGVGLTRSQAEKLAKEGRVSVEGQVAQPGRRLAPGERVELVLPRPAPRGPLPEPISLDILFEDEHLAVVNKPQRMAVHPGLGRPTGTLVNALLARYPNLGGGLPHRPGIVHRLDKDTSGLMVVARTEQAFEDLSHQVRSRELERRYLALAWGQPGEDRMIVEVPIARHSRAWGRMAAVASADDARQVRAARTELQVLERLGPMTLVEARLATGRTHQIRVHLAHLGHPVVGDRVYGTRQARKEKLALDAETLKLVAALPGQALHAHLLSFRHPVTGQRMSFSVPPPREMAELTGRLRGVAQQAGDRRRRAEDSGGEVR